MAAEKRGFVHLRERTAGLLELPKDLLLDMPRLTLYGNLQLSIENHHGVLQYLPEEIVILGGNDIRVSIRGHDLMIGVIYEEEITIVGTIESITLFRSEMQRRK